MLWIVSMGSNVSRRRNTLPGLSYLGDCYQRKEFAPQESKFFSLRVEPVFKWMQIEEKYLPNLKRSIPLVS